MGLKPLGYKKNDEYREQWQERHLYALTYKFVKIVYTIVHCIIEDDAHFLVFIIDE